MNRIETSYPTVTYEAGAGPGGGAPAAGETKPAAGETKPAAGETKPAAETKTAAPDAHAAAAQARQEAFDRYRLSDDGRQLANELLDEFEELDPAQRASLIFNAKRAQANAAAAPAEKTPARKTAPAAAPEAEAEAPDPIRQRQENAEQRIARLEAELDGARQEKRQAAEQKEWATTVEAALKDVPALEELTAKAKHRAALTAAALGYVATNMRQHGSRAKALKAFIDDQVELLADAAGMSTKSWLERKIESRAAASADGGGRPPAETLPKYDPKDLESGKVLRDTLKELGLPG